MLFGGEPADGSGFGGISTFFKLKPATPLSPALFISSRRAAGAGVELLRGLVCEDSVNFGGPAAGGGGGEKKTGEELLDIALLDEGELLGIEELLDEAELLDISLLDEDKLLSIEGLLDGADLLGIDKLLDIEELLVDEEKEFNGAGGLVNGEPKIIG